MFCLSFNYLISRLLIDRSCEIPSCWYTNDQSRPRYHRSSGFFRHRLILHHRAFLAVLPVPPLFNKEKRKRENYCATDQSAGPLRQIPQNSIISRLSNRHNMYLYCQVFYDAWISNFACHVQRRYVYNYFKSNPLITRVSNRVQFMIVKIIA